MIDDSTHTTRFRNCDWIVAWDEAARSHVYLRNADFVIRGADIVHVGEGYSGRSMPRSMPPDDDHSRLRQRPQPSRPRTGLEGHAGGTGQPAPRPELALRIHAGLPDRPRIHAPGVTGRTSELLKSGVHDHLRSRAPRETWADEYAETGIRAVLWGMFRPAPGKHQWSFGRI